MCVSVAQRRWSSGDVEPGRLVLGAAGLLSEALGSVRRLSIAHAQSVRHGAQKCLTSVPGVGLALDPFECQCVRKGSDGL